MALAKHYEEIVERYIGGNHAARTHRPAACSKPQAPKPALRYCPLCYEGFILADALDEHIAGRHGKQHVFLRINNQVVRDICWLKGVVKECSLVVLKVPRVDLRVVSNGVSREFSVTEDTDLVEHFPSDCPDDEITIEVRCGPLNRRFRIYRGKQPSFRSDRIDEAAEMLMKKLLGCERVDLTAFRDGCIKHRLNELEARYLDGIVEYCHGLGLEHERKRELARDRTESAMGLLIPFRTPIADQIRHALALRMNCFLGQWGCPPRSQFRAAEEFFCRARSEEDLPDDSPMVGRVEVAIDPASRLILDALEAYHGREDEVVFRTLAQIEVRDRNDEDKASLIDARTRARRGDERGARAAYEKFRAHPIFGEEAGEYLMPSGRV